MSERHPDRPSDRLSEAEAARLWQRAAQLQAEAKHSDPHADEDAAGDGASDVSEGYAIAHVREAALEAGIGAEFLDAALADIEAERAIARKARNSRLARLLLSDPPDAITVRRVIEASPRSVLRAMEDVFAREAYHLSLTDRKGDPLNGGLLTFKIEGASFVATEGFKGQASAADLREVLVTLRPVDDRQRSTEVILRGPVAWAHGIQASLGSVIVGTAGALGLGIGWLSSVGITTALLGAGPIAAPILAAIAVTVTTGSVGVAGALGVQGFRAMYDHGTEKGRVGLETLLYVLAVEAQGGWGLDELGAGGSEGEPGLLGDAGG